jgi:hypothetical protein
MCSVSCACLEISILKFLFWLLVRLALSILMEFRVSAKVRQVSQDLLRKGGLGINLALWDDGGVPLGLTRLCKYFSGEKRRCVGVIQRLRAVTGMRHGADGPGRCVESEGVEKRVPCDGGVVTGFLVDRRAGVGTFDQEGIGEVLHAGCVARERRVLRDEVLLVEDGALRRRRVFRVVNIYMR